MPTVVICDGRAASWAASGWSSVELMRCTRAYGVGMHLWQGNTAYINGTMNEAVRQADAEYVCLFHDDVVFNPLDHLPVTKTIIWAVENAVALKDAAAFTLGYAQVWASGSYGATAPERWDHPDSQDYGDGQGGELERPAFWRGLVAKWSPTVGAPQLGDPPRVAFDGFDVSYMTVPRPTHWARLGPCAQIVEWASWARVGGFDETEGVFYDQCFPMRLRKRLGGNVHVLAVPGLVCLHLHNQSLFLDPAQGVWGSVSENIRRAYGESWEDHVRRCA